MKLPMKEVITLDKMEQLKTSGKESRRMDADMEIRADEENVDSNKIVGYALKFNRWSDTLFGFFREKIDQNALDDADMSNVVALFNHDSNKILGRTGKNLRLSVDDIGLRFEVELNETSYAQDLKENIRSGIVSQCSFAFSIDEEGDEWREGEDGLYDRTIRKIHTLYDVSPVTTPAYSDTEVVVSPRSKEKLEALMHQNKAPSEDDLRVQRELELMDIELNYKKKEVD